MGGWAGLEVGVGLNGMGKGYSYQTLNYLYGVCKGLPRGTT